MSLSIAASNLRTQFSIFRQHSARRRRRGFGLLSTLSSSGRTNNEKTITTCDDARCFSTNSKYNSVVDMRSDTVTLPCKAMFDAAMDAPLGDDVMDEDPTVLDLQAYMADMFGKEEGLFLPTCSMANLTAILSHCDRRASEIIVGANSHISIWEGGNAATLGGVHTRQIIENPIDATLDHENIRDAFCTDDDVHYAKTSLICIENTYNAMGGVALSPQYVSSMGKLAHEELGGIPLHIDGARIFNACVAHNVTPAEMCKDADSVSICYSKGLGAPLGSVLVGESEFIRLAKRARKSCGGGMRQAGVVAAMGRYAVDNNVSKLADDHRRAKRFVNELKRYDDGFQMLAFNEKTVDTNLIFFTIPENSLITKEELPQRLLDEYNVKISGGYSKGGKYFRAVTHLDINDEDIDRALEGIIKLCLG